ncbi:outer membrane protein assembly factor [Modicisalibacter tunisiensis]|uniref:autotransporter assembly complex protein TamA n=1 Tax=Modicisalibacter tunisiensis TaxID=390637 RepID=UPI001CCD51AD|nr:autotransporter assembly complex family protein [Modicisalibacter tunisiensis]MBZ9538159.1 outer membrane protein assembly factor [Modicisalibacter tunisiensis]
MRYPRLALYGAAVAFVWSTSVLALDARVTGIDGEPADNIRHYLASMTAGDYSRDRLTHDIKQRAAKALKAYGYYLPSFQVVLEGKPDVERARIEVSPGKPVIIQHLEVSIEGEARDDKTFTQALEAFPLHEGDPLRHAPYEGLRSRLSTLALQRGYFDATFTRHRIEVRPWQNSARIYLTFDSGPRYRFGDIRFSGSQIDQERLVNLLPFATGEPYLADSLAEYNQRLGQTGWFRSIGVRPQIERTQPVALAHRGWWEAVDHRPAGGEAAVSGSEPLLSADAIVAARGVGTEGPPRVPVDVSVIPADRHQFEIGVGYATDVGPRTQFSWKQPWINADGDSLDHALYLSAPEQTFSGTYTMPLENPRRDSYELQYGLKNQDNKDTRSLEASVELARRWTFDNDWTQRVFVHATYEDFRQANQKGQVLLYYPGVSWSRTRTRNPRFPTWGDRQRLSLAASDTVWGSDASFLRATLDSQWIRSLGSDYRFIGRTSLGAMTTPDFDKIPPSLRFFTGGDRSVRGYAYESLAPTNADGDLVGGQQLFVASVEAQRRLTGNWWGAAFVDTGNAFNTWWPQDLATGAGLGIRWVSPVGPIRLDIAHPFDDKESSWRLHFAIGPEF